MTQEEHIDQLNKARAEGRAQGQQESADFICSRLAKNLAILMGIQGDAWIRLTANGIFQFARSNIGREEKPLIEVPTLQLKQ